MYKDLKTAIINKDFRNIVTYVTQVLSENPKCVIELLRLAINNGNHAFVSFCITLYHNHYNFKPIFLSILCCGYDDHMIFKDIFQTNNYFAYTQLLAMFSDCYSHVISLIPRHLKLAVKYDQVVFFVNIYKCCDFTHYPDFKNELLEWACICGSQNIIKYLISNDICKFTSVNPILHIIQFNHFKTFESLFDCHTFKLLLTTENIKKILYHIVEYDRVRFYTKMIAKNKVNRKMIEESLELAKSKKSVEIEKILTFCLSKL